jgi:hypothetical protein
MDLTVTIAELVPVTPGYPEGVLAASPACSCALGEALP